MLLTQNTRSFTLKRNFLRNFTGLRVASEDKLYLLPEVLDVRSSALCHRHAHYLRHTGRGRLKHDCKRLPLRLAAGVAVMSAVSAAGLGAVIAATPVAFYGLQTIGALVLVWMAIKSWRAPAADPASVAAAHAGDCSGKTKRAQFLEAALLQVTNPMLIVYLLSLLPQFVHPEDDYVPRITLLIGLFVVLVWAVHVLYSYTAAFAGRRMKGKTFYMILNRTSAVLFWLLAAGVFWNIAGR